MSDAAEMREGVVTRFGSRGFGFIVDTETRTEHFVHIADVIGRKELRTGDKVRFQLGKELPGKSPQAIQVELIAVPRRIDTGERQ